MPVLPFEQHAWISGPTPNRQYDDRSRMPDDITASTDSTRLFHLIRSDRKYRPAITDARRNDACLLYFRPSGFSHRQQIYRVRRTQLNEVCGSDTLVRQMCPSRAQSQDDSWLPTMICCARAKEAPSSDRRSRESCNLSGSGPAQVWIHHHRDHQPRCAKLSSKCDPTGRAGRRVRRRRPESDARRHVAVVLRARPRDSFGFCISLSSSPQQSTLRVSFQRSARQP